MSRKIVTVKHLVFVLDICLIDRNIRENLPAWIESAENYFTFAYLLGFLGFVNTRRWSMILFNII